MILQYIQNNYKKGEPIFIDKLPCKSKDTLRQELKYLTDKGKLNRYCNGVYYIPFKTILGIDGTLSIETLLNKKYIGDKNNTFGYFTGVQNVNESGFTSQNSAVYEICTNKATTLQRKITINNYRIVLFKPVLEINNDNWKTLQFMDLLLSLNKYTELDPAATENNLKKYIISNNINFNYIKQIISLYPDIIYKILYERGLMNELVSK